MRNLTNTEATDLTGLHVQLVDPATGEQHKSFPADSLSVKPLYAGDIASAADGTVEGQFLYVTDTGDEFGQITEVYTWIGGIWSPYPQPLQLWSNATGTLTNVFPTEPVSIESGDPASGTQTAVLLDPATGAATIYASDKVILNSGGEYEFVNVPEDVDLSAPSVLVYDPSTYKVEHRSIASIAGAPVTVGIDPPVGDPVEGAIHLVTDDGTPTGTVLEQYIYDTDSGVWIEMQRNAQDTLKFGTTAPTSNGEWDGEEFFVTSDGTSAGTVLEQWVWDKQSTTWVKRPASGKVTFGDAAPTTNGTVDGEEYLVTVDGTSATAVSAEYIWDEDTSLWVQRQPLPDACIGSHFEQDVYLAQGAPLTLTHNFNLTNPRAVGYSVIGVDGVTVGDWPTGVRFINHSVNSLDVVADTGSGFVDVMLMNHECLSWLSKGKPALEGSALAISYETPKIYTVGTNIGSLRPSANLSGFGTPTYTVAPALPNGLTLNPLTGVISGTPTTVSASTLYTVTCIASTGAATAVIDIAVVSGATAPSGLSFTPASRSFPVGSAITTFGPTLISDGGAPVTYSVSPTLPAGLSLNTVTGAISGTPTAVSAVTTYTMTATNTIGSTTATFTLDIYASLAGWTLANSPASGALNLGNGITATTTATNGTVTTTSSGYSMVVASSRTVALSAPLKNLRLIVDGLNQNSTGGELFALDINGVVRPILAPEIVSSSNVVLDSQGRLKAVFGSGITGTATVEIFEPNGINNFRLAAGGTASFTITVAPYVK